MFSNASYPLRIDSVPSGAYVVPWMMPCTNITQLSEGYDIDQVMAYAMKFDITFKIETTNGTGIIPSTIYLGHDSEYLYVGGKFVGMGSNPATPPHGWTPPNVFSIFFDTANSGTLTTPESGSGVGVNIDVPQETLVADSYEDIVWVYEPNIYKRMIWMPASNYLGPIKGQTVTGIRAQACTYDNSTGTITILLARFLRKPDMREINALQIRSGERWVMGFLLQLEYQTDFINQTTNWPINWADGWPRNVYQKWSNDSSWWPKIVIDLTNPPSIIPGQPQQGIPH